MVAIIKDDDSYRHKRERTKKKYFTQNTFVVLLPKEEKTKNTEMCAKVSFFVVELFSHTFFFVYLTYICTYTRI